MNWKEATDSQLLQIIYHEPNVPLAEIQRAAEEYARRYGEKWSKTEGKAVCYETGSVFPGDSVGFDIQR